MSVRTSEAQPAFLLTRDWRDTRDGIELTFWARTARDAVRITVSTEQAVCFVEREAHILPGRYTRRQVALASPRGRPVDALYFGGHAALRSFAESPPVSPEHLFESDIRPPDRFLMERFIQGPMLIRGEAEAVPRHRRFADPHLAPGEFRPPLAVVSMDIETDFESGVLFSIGVSGDTGERVFLRTASDAESTAGHDGDMVVEPCADERALIARFLDWIEETDPDVIVGWNVVGFDLAVLERRCRALKIPFALGRERGLARILPARGPGGTAQARVPGRVIMDGIESLRAAFYNFENFSLDHVAAQLLGRGKLIAEPASGHRGEEIRRLYREDPAALARYNLEDCRLAADIFRHTKLVDFAVERAASTGLALGRAGGSVAAFDFLYLPRLHRRGYVAPDPAAAAAGGLSSPGGYVLDSTPGLFEDVLVFDFKSLYPSIIRTFLIDPLALWLPGGERVAGFDGASFSRDAPILPDIIGELWRRRDAARAARNQPLSQAVKIIMNSFYGVLGASGCRFCDARLTSSITRRGHEIIRRSKAHIEAQGLAVIYGDTDSLFVWLDGRPGEDRAAATGRALAAELNDFWKRTILEEHDLASFLEIEFESHYLKFLMPTVRRSGAGSKKRYAGMVRTGDGGTALVFRGLETVRSDWTALARRFQHELFRRIFNDQPYEAYVREVHAGLYRGEFDDALVYRKQLRQEIGRYQRNVPPHVQAARKLERPGRRVEYIICASGPEPAVPGAPPPDYDHYSERQLKPVADTILVPIGTSYDEIVGGQMELFR